MPSNSMELVRVLVLRCRGLLHDKAAAVLHDGGAKAGVYAAWCMCAVAAVILGCVSVPRSRVTVAEDHRGEDSVARSLRNCDAGDSDARHVGDGHLE